MSERRVVITGIGVVSAAGLGLEVFRSALLGETACPDRAEVLQGTGFDGQPARGVPAFDAKALLGVKGLRHLNRATLLACGAARLALDDAEIVLDAQAGAEMGVVLGTAFANFGAECAFDAIEAAQGYRFLDPLAFPNTVVSTPAGHVALMFGVRRFNGTVSSGEAAGLDAIILAARHLRRERAVMALAGGVEDLSRESYARLRALGRVAQPSADAGRAAPFDRKRTGSIPSEGGAFVLLEDLEHARARRARIYAEVTGAASGFDAARYARYRAGDDPFAAGGATSVRVLSAALEDAAVPPAEVDCISAGASGSPSGDRMEAQAIDALFGAAAPPISAAKGALGETLGAAGAFQVAASALSCHEGWIPPTAGYGEADPECGLPSVVARAPVYRHVGTALVHSYDPGGIDSALVVAGPV
ncbi:MAG TPA: beta-ketoacyl synthase N-terminal-like domain-containing protein [Vicinamibacteria bacterium]|jgi:3-oxoacyl-[acyl-carrier-protein] synthase II